jgi:hypothetical protein
MHRPAMLGGRAELQHLNVFVLLHTFYCIKKEGPTQLL